MGLAGWTLGEGAMQCPSAVFPTHSAPAAPFFPCSSSGDTDTWASCGRNVICCEAIQISSLCIPKRFTDILSLPHNFIQTLASHRPAYLGQLFWDASQFPRKWLLLAGRAFVPGDVVSLGAKVDWEDHLAHLALPPISPSLPTPTPHTHS